LLVEDLVEERSGSIRRWYFQRQDRRGGSATTTIASLEKLLWLHLRDLVRRRRL
jgi:hypothetical protein